MAVLAVTFSRSVSVFANSHGCFKSAYSVALGHHFGRGGFYQQSFVQTNNLNKPAPSARTSFL